MSKIDALESALHFIRTKIAKEDPHDPAHVAAVRMSDTLQTWRRALRKVKRKKRVEKLEELSSEKLSLDDVYFDWLQYQLRCMWENFVAVFQMYENCELKGQKLTKKQLIPKPEKFTQFVALYPLSKEKQVKLLQKLQTKQMSLREMQSARREAI